MMLLSAGSASAFDVASLVFPARLSPGLVAKRIATPPQAPILENRDITVELAPAFTPELTNQLLEAYVARQQAVQGTDIFILGAAGELTDEVLSSYVAKKRNPALEAIEAAEGGRLGLRPSIDPDALAAYVKANFLPTEARLGLATNEKLCLTQAIYHEARGESTDGQWAVASVIVNRAFSKKFPSTICGVVFENANKGRYRCQFTFACDGRSDFGTEKRAWAKASDIASKVYAEFISGETPGVIPTTVLYYHTRAVSPSWSHKFRQVASIGSHLFYSVN